MSLQLLCGKGHGLQLENSQNLAPAIHVPSSPPHPPSKGEEKEEEGGEWKEGGGQREGEGKWGTVPRLPIKVKETAKTAGRPAGVHVHYVPGRLWL